MIVNEAGLIVPPGIGHGRNQFIDGFRRSNGPLSNGWTDLKTLEPDSYEPCGIYDNAMVCTNPVSRPGDYFDNQETATGGDLYLGIGGAVRDCGTDIVTVTYEYNGLWTAPVHTEGGPMINFTPGTPEGGFSFWLTYAGPFAFPTIGNLGNPPELWDPVASTQMPHVEGQNHSITFVSDGEAVVVWMDGAQINFNLIDAPGLDPYPIPEALLGSHLHGFTFDTHLVIDFPEIPTTKVANGVSISTGV